jgi:hypothetical protein
LSQHAFEMGQMWTVYNDVEKELMGFLDYVPPAPEHNKVYSFKLLRLLLQIGGYVDTAFKEMAFHSDFNGDVNCIKIREKATKGRTVSINLFREAFEPIYKLSKKTVYVRSLEFFEDLPIVVDGFNPFAQFGDGKTPQWWKAYNEVKHDWLKNLKRANLENALRALGGAFLLNVVHVPSLLELASRGIAETFDAGFQSRRFSDELLAKMIRREQPLNGNLIAVDTRLFRWRFS